MYDAWQRMFLLQVAKAKTELRPAIWQGLDSPHAVREFQNTVRTRMWEELGGVSEHRCDIQATITGTVQAPGYRIEKLHFQSLPNFFVSANLYLPDELTGKAPAVLIACGHQRVAKAWHEYQTLAANLARRGFVVLVFDPLGQAERGPVYSYFYGDARGNAHDVQGYQCQLTGRPLSFYFVWDSIRALDYLCSRDEVDAGRIACTGNSGGGMQTTHLAALDERVSFAIPVCNTGSHFDVFTSWMLHPEGNFVDVFDAYGASNENLAMCVAPRRQLLIAAAEDHLSATGMDLLFNETRQIYTAAGAGSNMEMATILEHHSYSRPMRELVYARLVEALKPGGESPVAEDETPIFLTEELNTTSTGHVEELGSKSVHQLNLQLARELAEQHQSLALDYRQLKRELSRIYVPDDDFRINGRLQPLNAIKMVNPLRQTEDMATMRQYRYATVGDELGLQALNLYEPMITDGSAMIFIRDPAEVLCGDLLRAALERDVVVITGELPACDEGRMLLTGITPAGYYWLIWRDIVEQLQRKLNFSTIHIVAWGRLANLVAFTLAAEQMEQLQSLTLINGYLTLVDCLVEPRQDHAAMQNTPGLLKHFDIPQIIAALGETRIIIANPFNELDEVQSVDDLEAALQPLRRLLRASGREVNLTALMEPEEKLYARVGDLIFK